MNYLIYKNKLFYMKKLKINFYLKFLNIIMFENFSEVCINVWGFIVIVFIGIISNWCM